jgi:hypothetical protein
MKLWEALLRAARAVDDVYEGEASSGSPTYITDTSMTQQSGYYTNGTVVISSGSMAGTVEKITQHTANKLTFNSIGTAPAVGDRFTAITKDFTASAIRSAIYEALSGIETPHVDKTHAATDGECTLTDVSNVRRVLVDDQPNHFWKEINGTLVFDDGATGALEIWYMAQPAKPEEWTDELDAPVDPEWITWATVVNLLRKRVQSLKKDNPTLLDMLNEAKNKEAVARAQASRRHMLSLPYSPRYGVLK